MDRVHVDQAKSLNIAVVNFNIVFYEGKIDMKNTLLTVTKITLQAVALVFTVAFGTVAMAEEKKEATITLQGHEKLATINGKDITVLDWNVEFQSLPEETQKQGQNALYLPLLDTLINKTAIADKAIAEGLAETKEYKAFLAKTKRDVLSQMYVDMKLDKILAEVDLKQEYEKVKSEWKGQQEIETSHILVKSRKDAEDIIVALNNGADFKALAKAKSTGPSGPAGGGIGWVSKGQTVPPFEEALFDLDNGDISEKPVKTQFGWHVISRENSREKRIPTFESMESQLRQAVIDRELAKLIESVMKTAKVKRHEIEDTK